MFGAAKKGWALTTHRLLAATSTAHGSLDYTALNTVRGDGEAEDQSLVFESATDTFVLRLKEYQIILIGILERSISAAAAASRR